MNLQPYPDQWAFLVSVTPMNVQDIEPTILRATGSIHPLDVNFINEEDLGTPWEEKKIIRKQTEYFYCRTAENHAGKPDLFRKSAITSGAD